MADADDKSAAADEQAETEQTSAAAAEETSVDGEAAAGTAKDDAAEETSGESAEESGSEETSADAPSADGNGEASAEAGSETEAVTDDIWAEALKEAGDVDESATPEVVSEQPAESAAISDAAEPADFSELTGNGTGRLANMDMILDIPVTISVELGRAEMMIKDILQLGQGSVVELEKMAGEAMEILVNGRLVARGEVVMVNEKFGVRLTDIISPSERVKRLA